MALKHRRILVTGGAGFIGSHLAEHFSRENEVIVLDNLVGGSPVNLGSFADRIAFEEGSILDARVLGRVMKGVGVVLHEAALPSVVRSVKEPAVAHETNVTGTLNVLEAARKADVPTVVFASSSSVYGEGAGRPKRETDVLEPTSPYGASKAAAEQYLHAFRRTYGLRTVSLRYFNVFGPRQNPRGEYAAVVPRFLTAMLREKRPTVYGDGLQTRDFTYVENVILGNELAAERNVSGAFNVASGRETSINELVGLMNQAMGKSLSPLHAEARTGEIRRSVANVAKARKELGYRPAVSLEQGLRRTADHLARRMEAERKRGGMA